MTALQRQGKRPKNSKPEGDKQIVLLEYFPVPASSDNEPYAACFDGTERSYRDVEKKLEDFFPEFERDLNASRANQIALTCWENLEKQQKTARQEKKANVPSSADDSLRPRMDLNLTVLDGTEKSCKEIRKVLECKLPGFFNFNHKTRQRYANTCWMELQKRQKLVKEASEDDLTKPGRYIESSSAASMQSEHSRAEPLQSAESTRSEHSRAESLYSNPSLSSSAESMRSEHSGAESLRSSRSLPERLSDDSGSEDSPEKDMRDLLAAHLEAPYEEARTLMQRSVADEIDKAERKHLQKIAELEAENAEVRAENGEVKAENSALKVKMKKLVAELGRITMDPRSLEAMGSNVTPASYKPEKFAPDAVLQPSNTCDHHQGGTTKSVGRALIFHLNKLTRNIFAQSGSKSRKRAASEVSESAETPTAHKKKKHKSSKKKAGKGVN
ncbi:uncharacterized protein J3D65DRAFT_635694 [Phyllosticta citribraziliensis]|uniref:Uncharacterized protein n=1 Tax=Phyllosticta citribraziliensis TaxID=989973 RepID=A0ABR1L9Z7_9PEZI